MRFLLCSASLLLLTNIDGTGSAHEDASRTAQLQNRVVQILCNILKSAWLHQALEHILHELPELFGVKAGGQQDLLYSALHASYSHTAILGIHEPRRYRCMD